MRTSSEANAGERRDQPFRGPTLRRATWRTARAAPGLSLFVRNVSLTGSGESDAHTGVALLSFLLIIALALPAALALAVDWHIRKG